MVDTPKARKKGRAAILCRQTRFIKQFFFVPSPKFATLIMPPSSLFCCSGLAPRLLDASDRRLSSQRGCRGVHLYLGPLQLSAGHQRALPETMAGQRPQPQPEVASLRPRPRRPPPPRPHGQAGLVLDSPAVSALNVVFLTAAATADGRIVKSERSAGCERTGGKGGCGMGLDGTAETRARNALNREEFLV